MEIHSKGKDRTWNPVTDVEISKSNNSSPACTLSTSELYGDWTSSRLTSASPQSAEPNPEPSEAVFRVLRRPEPTLSTSTNTPVTSSSPISTNCTTYAKDIVTSLQAGTEAIIKSTMNPISGSMTRFVDIATRLNNALSSTSGELSEHSIHDLICENTDKTSHPKARVPSTNAVDIHCSTSTTSSPRSCSLGVDVTSSSSSNLLDGAGCASTTKKSMPLPIGEMREKSVLATFVDHTSFAKLKRNL
jgi:hypothetical protein